MEDVQLVQFGFFCASQMSDTDAEERDLYGTVVPGLPYGGAVDDPLSLSIRLFAKKRHSPDDGHISVMKGTGLVNKNLAFAMVGLSNCISAVMPGDYPRLDNHPRCPLLLAERVKTIFHV